MMRWAKPFDDRGLADARLADQHGVVLGAAGEHLDDAADLFVAADHRIEFALCGQLGQVAAIAFECFIGGFGILRRDPLAAAHFLQRLHEAVASEAELLEDSARGAAIVGSCQQQMLHGDVVILEPFGLVFRLRKQTVQAAGKVNLIGPAGRPGDFRQAAISCSSRARIFSTFASARFRIEDAKSTLLFD